MQAKARLPVLPAGFEEAVFYVYLRFPAVSRGQKAASSKSAKQGSAHPNRVCIPGYSINALSTSSHS